MKHLNFLTIFFFFYDLQILHLGVFWGAEFDFEGPGAAGIPEIEILRGPGGSRGSAEWRKPLKLSIFSLRLYGGMIHNK